MKIFKLLALLFLVASIPFAAKGASDKSSLLSMPTTSKTIYLLFHKVAGRSVNIAHALSNTEAYKKASPSEQAQIMATQQGPTEAEFALMDAKKQVIVVRTAVSIRAQLSPRPTLKASLNSPDRPASSIYFPYSWANVNFAVIPDKIEPFLDIPLTVPEVTAAAAKIHDNSATMVIEMLPLSADNRSSMPLDGVDQWLLMTKIVSVAYYSQNMDTIWQWQAPDYRRAGSASPLQDLKK